MDFAETAELRSVRKTMAGTAGYFGGTYDAEKAERDEPTR